MRNFDLKNQAIELIQITPLLNPWQKELYVSRIQGADDETCIQVINLLVGKDEKLARGLENMQAEKALIKIRNYFGLKV